MKIINISLLSILLSITLFARENPFEPTDQYIEEKKLLINKQAKEEEEAKLAKQKAEQERVAKAIAAQKQAQELEEAKKAEVAKQKELEELRKQQALLEAQKQEKEIQQTKQQVSPQKKLEKPYIPTIKENFKVLPFVKIYIVNDVLTIEVDPKYPLLNQDILKPEKKFLFDFRGKVSFYTVRNKIISEDFNSFAVGTHMEKNFFRVVIDLTDTMSAYEEQIDSKKGIITIYKK